MKKLWSWLATAAVALPLAQAHAGWNATVLHVFTGRPDGAAPMAGLLADRAGNLYGTTMEGGTHQAGTVFMLKPPARGKTFWTETVLHSFAAAEGGDTPDAPLISDSAGHLFGTTTRGGAHNAGTVFELAPPAAGGTAWTVKVLYAFQTANPPLNQAPLAQDASGNLYFAASPNGASCLNGCGVVIKLTKPAGGTGFWKAATIYRFSDGTKTGSYPQGGVVVDKAGNVYGTTQIGGGFGNPFGYGVVFALTPPTGGQAMWNETVLYRFQGGQDGAAPSAGLILGAAGNLYGTTAAGGGGPCTISIFTGCGTVFRLTPPAAAQAAWTETVLHRFTGHDGANPQAGLTFDTAGNLYGTTMAGGASKTSTVFTLTRPASRDGLWSETILHRFASPSDSAAPGLNPGVALGKAGQVYGTTLAAGKDSAGTVFELTQP